MHFDDGDGVLFSAVVISTMVSKCGLIRHQMCLVERKQRVPDFPLKIRIQDNLWTFEKVLFLVHDLSLDFRDTSMTFCIITHEFENG